MFVKLAILCLTATVGYAMLQCKTPKTVKDFDLEKFQGDWYEIETSGLVGKAAKCSVWKIEFKGNKKATVLHKFLSIVSKKTKTEYSDIVQESKSEPGKLSITPKKSTTFLDTKWTLSIVHTDYDKFAVAYSCQKTILKKEHVYIFSRTKTIDDKSRMDLYEILAKNDLPQKSLVAVDQESKDCD